jgi:hypothetical protein
MDNLFGKGISAYPANWSTGEFTGELELGSYVEVTRGPYAELRGVVTYLEKEFAWVRLDGDQHDLRFGRELLSPQGLP